MALTQISTNGIKDSNVTTADIADQAVSLDKLPHGTSSNDGKFLRANNGADPSFETVTSTTINNNADNRVITGSGTTNSLEAEPNLTFDNTNSKLTVGSGGVIQSTSSGGNLAIGGGNTNPGGQILFNGGNGDANIVFKAEGYTSTPAERMRIDSSGNIGIGTTSPSQPLHVEESTVNKGLLTYNTNTTSNASVPLFLASESGGSTTNISIENLGAGNIGFRTGATTKDGYGSERMRIDASGQVGILESTPRGQLQVNSNKNIKSDLHSNTNSHLHLRNPQDDTGEGCGISFSVTSNETKVGASIFHEREGGGSEGSLNFATNVDGNTTREQMQLSSGGILTRPYTPSFAAHSISLGTTKSFGQGHGSTLWDTNYLEPMPVWGHNQNGASVHTIYNNGNDMSFHTFTTSGGQAAGYIKFTAPVTGSYVFWIAGCTITTDNGDWIAFGLNKNFTGNNASGDLDYYISQMHNDGSDARRCMNGQVTVPLSANDYVVLYARSPNVTSILDRIVFGGYQLY